ncbi:MAG: DUF2231 domain-containing protein [Candidatus Nanopelagicales bacterium]|nr:DUF2231 domain-containing protein [Candidatus Nanopelagicales bacterium]
MSSLMGFAFPSVEISGVPLHPLVVHAVVVLVPLAALGLIVMASSVARSKRYSPAVLFVAAIAVVSAFVAQASGLALRDELNLPASNHFNAGKWEPWAAVAVLVGVGLLAGLDRKSGGKRNTLGTLVAFLGVVAAIVAIGWTVYTGHAGASLVWG